MDSRTEDTFSAVRCHKSRRCRAGAVYFWVSVESGAAGELPPTETWPELWVVDLSNVEGTKRLVAEARRAWRRPAGRARTARKSTRASSASAGTAGRTDPRAWTPESRLFAGIDRRSQGRRGASVGPGACLSVSNSSSGRRWKLDHAPAVGDPTHMVEFGTGRRAFAREA